MARYEIINLGTLDPGYPSDAYAIRFNGQYFAGYDFMGSVNWVNDPRNAWMLSMDYAKQYVSDLESADDTRDVIPDYNPVTWRGTMTNVQIVVTDNRTIVVIADTKRCGKHAIMYEGHTFMQACDYIRRTTGKDRFHLDSWAYARTFTDPDGKTMPWIQTVRF